MLPSNSMVAKTVAKSKREKAPSMKVKKEATWVRKTLAGVIGKQVRRIPELHFYVDDSLDYYEAVEEALKN